jgi:hypothetical protein
MNTITPDALVKRLNDHLHNLKKPQYVGQLDENIHAPHPEWLLLNWRTQRFRVLDLDDLANLARTEGVLADGETVEGEHLVDEKVTA